MDTVVTTETPLNVDYSDQIEKVCHKMTCASREGSFTEIPLKDSCKSTVKLPRRVLHFSDGILEEYSTDDDDEVDIDDSKPLIDPKTLPWMPYLWYLTTWLGARTLAVCDYLGEYLAYFFGITSPKFQYEIDEYKRIVEEEEEVKQKEAEENAGWGNSGASDSSLKTVDVEPPSLNAVPDADSSKAYAAKDKAYAAKESNLNEIELTPQNWERF